jgi:hypothetical protein
VARSDQAAATEIARVMAVFFIAVPGKANAPFPLENDDATKDGTAHRIAELSLRKFLAQWEL